MTDNLENDELVGTFEVIDEMTELIAALEESGSEIEVEIGEMGDADVKSR